MADLAEPGPVLTAAQYLRKSSEHQKYSLENQAAAIALYALRHGYNVVRTYADAGRSGLTFKGRPALKALVADVLSPGPPFRTILVFDVSRWGRYQDPDQAAHYEFICREAGVQVRYCGETFENDGSLSSSIMKQLKRVMAAEYSRELGVRVCRGQRRIASLGFSAGGPAPYGFRRQLVDQEGRPRMILASGQVKAIATDRVRLTLGPAEEIEAVRLIFQMYLRGRMSIRGITRTLRASHLPAPAGGWSSHKVGSILTNEIYRGVRVYGRRTGRLRTPSRRTPEAEWISVRVAPPVVPERTFRRALELRGTRYRRRTQDDIVTALRRALAKTGRLTSVLVDNSPDLPNKNTIQDRFGSLTKAFALAGQPVRKGVTKWRAEDLIAELQRLQAQYGSTGEDVLRRDPKAPLPRTFAKWFGSLQEAQLAAGVPSTAPQAPTRKPRRATGDLILDLQRIHRRHGVLRWRDIEADPRISARTVRRRFGSLKKARVAAGLS
jgi:DNA invertase Pin-like site-specific DNA recombinase